MIVPVIFFVFGILFSLFLFYSGVYLGGKEALRVLSEDSNKCLELWMLSVSKKQSLGRAKTKEKSSKEG